MKSILAIDPGTNESGWVMFSDGRVAASGIDTNEIVLQMIAGMPIQARPLLAIENIASYGMPVGAEVFATCRWIGRFQQAWHSPDAVMLIFRKDVKMHLCGTPRAKDGNIRQALIDLLGPQGTKANRGPTYGVRSHAWAALAVAVTAAAQIESMATQEAA